MYIEADVFCQGSGNMIEVSRYQQSISSVESDSGGGGSRMCARDAMSPAQMLPPAPAPPSVKNERSSPHDSIASGSRSETPSTSSYPSTTPDRVSPLAPPPPAPPPAPPRHYSEIMRTLAARYNTNTTNDYFHRNEFGVEQPPPAQVDVGTIPLGGLFAKLATQLGGPPQGLAFPPTYDMNATKTLLAISRVAQSGRSRRKRNKRSVSEHCPLDLSTSDAKRQRLSDSPVPRSDAAERDKVPNGEGGAWECLCAEARARLSALTVGEVYDFVNSIDICAEYATNFLEQRIDGSGLPLLTEEHLTGMLQMKLGPALKLLAAVAKNLEPCAQCLASGAQTIVINGTNFKLEPRSNTTSPS